ncbi:hypothetical protein Nepgr_009403 [Nepenthes gracilis]|uniref:Uncharacterized protein n=1 Tax=Nepenthes gracilis TaxID=150966 RepID=A0AAD3SAI6_NEPGR|nr:hypothetical protein Nepgr_009403 [Nepenthes gracilis]
MQSRRSSPKDPPRQSAVNPKLRLRLDKNVGIPVDSKLNQDKQPFTSFKEGVAKLFSSKTHQKLCGFEESPMETVEPSPYRVQFNSECSRGLVSIDDPRVGGPRLGGNRPKASSSPAFSYIMANKEVNCRTELCFPRVIHIHLQDSL